MKITHDVAPTICYAIVVTYPDGHTKKLSVRFMCEAHAIHYIRTLPIADDRSYYAVKENCGEH